MKTKAVRLLLLLLMVAGLLVPLFLRSVRAQTFTVDFDFTSSDNGFTAYSFGGTGPRAVYTGGLGWAPNLSSGCTIGGGSGPGSNCAALVQIQAFSFSSSVVITSAEFILDTPLTGPGCVFQFANGDPHAGGVTEFDYSVCSGDYTATGLTLTAGTIWFGIAQSPPNDVPSRIKHIILRGSGVAFPSDTPTVTDTPTIGPTATLAAGGMFPTFDARPMCTMTPTPGSSTATRSSLFSFPTGTPTFEPTATGTLGFGGGGGGGGFTPFPTDTLAPWQSPNPPTLTATATRSVGDCRSPEYPHSTGSNIDAAFDYRRDGGGAIVEDCNTIIPGISIGIPGIIRDVVNAVAGSTVFNSTNSAITINQVDVCVKYREFVLVLVGIDFAPWISMVLGFGLIIFVIRTVREEL